MMEEKKVEIAALIAMDFLNGLMGGLNEVPLMDRRQILESFIDQLPEAARLKARRTIWQNRKHFYQLMKESEVRGKE